MKAAKKRHSQKKLEILNAAPGMDEELKKGNAFQKRHFNEANV